MWYCSLNDQQQGPFSELELKALLERQNIQPQTRVRREHDAEWTPLELTSVAASLGLRPAAKIRLHRCAYSGMQTPRADMCQIDGFWVAKDYQREADDYVHNGGWLPTEVSGLRAKGNPGLGHVLFQTLILLRRAGLAACAANLAVNLPLLYFLKQASATHGNPDFLTVQVVDTARTAGWITLEALAVTLVFYLFSRHGRGDRPGPRDWYAAIKSSWGPVAGLLVLTLVVCLATSLICHRITYPEGGDKPTGIGILISVLSMVAFVLMILFGLFAPMIIVDRSLPPLAAAKQSRLISMEHLRRTLYYIVFSPLILSVPAGVLVGVSEAAWPGKSIPELLIDGVLCAAIIPAYAFWFCYYKELEALHIASQEGRG